MSGSNDETIRVWDASNGECVKVLRGHTGVSGSNRLCLFLCFFVSLFLCFFVCLFWFFGSLFLCFFVFFLFHYYISSFVS